MNKKIYVLVNTRKEKDTMCYPEVTPFFDYKLAHDTFLSEVKAAFNEWCTEYGADNVNVCLEDNGNNSVVNYMIENDDVTTEPRFDIYDVRDCVLKSQAIFIKECEAEEVTPEKTNSVETREESKKQKRAKNSSTKSTKKERKPRKKKETE